MIRYINKDDDEMNETIRRVRYQPAGRSAVNDYKEAGGDLKTDLFPKKGGYPKKEKK